MLIESTKDQMQEKVPASCLVANIGSLVVVLPVVNNFWVGVAINCSYRISLIYRCYAVYYIDYTLVIIPGVFLSDDG